MPGLLRRQLLKPQQTLPFEQRLMKAFPGSEWIECAVTPSDCLPAAPGPAPPTGAAALAVIGGANFDEASLLTWLRTLPRDVILVTTAPRVNKDGTPHAGDFAGKLVPLTTELGLRVDFVERKEHQYGTYAESVQLREVLRVTSGDVVLVGSGGKQKEIKALATRDWAMAKAVLGDREVIEV